MNGWILGLILVVTYLLGMLLGWWSVRNYHDYPFNWRVFLGPWVYERWVDRR